MGKKKKAKTAMKKSKYANTNWIKYYLAAFTKQPKNYLTPTIILLALKYKSVTTFRTAKNISEKANFIYGAENILGVVEEYIAQKSKKHSTR